MTTCTLRHFRQSLLETFNHRCIFCGRITNEIHEIIPKSKRPYSWMEFDNCVPLCREHHAEIHNTGASNHVKRLRERRDKILCLKEEI